MDIPHTPIIADQLGELFDKTFILWRATPLVHFLRRTHQELQTSLSEYLVDCLGYAIVRPHMDIPTVPTIYHIQFEYVKINDWEKVDAASQPLRLRIQIWYPSQASPTENILYFLPATIPRNADPTATMEDARDYPLILTKLRTGLSDIIKAWIQRQFACHVTSFHVPGGVMQALVNWWTDSLVDVYDYEDTEKLARLFSLELTFTVVTQPEHHLNTISINVGMKHLRKMHHLIQKVPSDITMMDLIHDHVHHTLRIDLDHLVLSCVGTPVAYLSNTSQIKLLSRGGSRHQYIQFLSELCDLACMTV